MNKVEILSFVATNQALEIMLRDGSTKSLTEDKYDIPNIIYEISPNISKRQIAVIDLDKHLWANKTTQSNNGDTYSGFGFVKFIKKVGAKIKSIFVGDDGIENTHETVVEESTVVAVVSNDDGTTTEIPNIQKIEKHVQHAKMTDPRAMENFLKRLAPVIDKRGHSVDDLLTFLGRQDLAIALDGSILAYKNLTTGTNDKAGFFVDPHSRNVPQNVGTLVYMDAANVDSNRARECSFGLHVGSRNYMGGYRGSAMFLVKVAPEDVIAVPSYDASKMRVCAYHIVGRFSDAARDTVYNRQSVSNIKADVDMIQDVINGNHIDIIHKVHIGGPNGTKLTINGKFEKEEPVVAKKIKPIKETKTEKVAKEEPSKKLSNADKAKNLIKSVLDVNITKASRINAANELVALKKKAKVSYAKLGLQPVDELKLAAALNGSLFENEREDKSKTIKPAVKTKAIVNIDDKSEAIQTTTTTNIKDIKKNLTPIINTHEEILKDFDSKMSYRKMSKKYRMSDKTLRKIIKQYR